MIEHPEAERVDPIAGDVRAVRRDSHERCGAGKIKAALEAELSFQNGVNSALVATILDHIVVKKGSTKEEVFLDIYLKFGDPYGVVFDRENSFFCFTRPKSTIHKAQIRRI